MQALLGEHFKSWFCPDQCGSVGWASSGKLKGHQFGSRSGPMSGLQVQSPRVCKRQPINISLLHWWFSPSVSPSLPFFSLEPINEKKFFNMPHSLPPTVMVLEAGVETELHQPGFLLTKMSPWLTCDGLTMGWEIQLCFIQPLRLWVVSAAKSSPSIVTETPQNHSFLGLGLGSTKK